MITNGDLFFMIRKGRDKKKRRDEMFKAYPMTRDGRRLPGVKLDKINPTVVVVDEMDMVVAKMENWFFPR